MVAVVAMASVLSVSTASARLSHEWLTSYKLNSGENSPVKGGITEVEGQVVSGGSAATCAEMRGLVTKCGGEGQAVDSAISELGIEGWIHDHSTWTSWFNAWYN